MQPNPFLTPRNGQRVILACVLFFCLQLRLGACGGWAWWMDQVSGTFDGISSAALSQNDILSGSGMAQNSINDAVGVNIYIDGTLVCQASPDGSDSGFGWSFSYNIGSLSPGSHTVDAQAGPDSYGQSADLGTQTFTVASSLPLPPPPPPPPAPSPAPPPAPADLSTIVPLYYFVGGTDNFYTTNFSEGINARYGFVDVACYADASNDPGTFPLYRYLNRTDYCHYYTTNWGEHGGGDGSYSYEGIACYVWPPSSSLPGLETFYSVWNNGGLGWPGRQEILPSTPTPPHSNGYFTVLGPMFDALPGTAGTGGGGGVGLSLAGLKALTPTLSVPDWVGGTGDYTYVTNPKGGLMPTVASQLSGLLPPAPNPDGGVSFTIGNNGNPITYSLSPFGWTVTATDSSGTVIDAVQGSYKGSSGTVSFSGSAASGDADVDYIVTLPGNADANPSLELKTTAASGDYVDYTVKSNGTISEVSVAPPPVSPLLPTPTTYTVTTSSNGNGGATVTLTPTAAGGSPIIYTVNSNGGGTVDTVDSNKNPVSGSFDSNDNISSFTEQNSYTGTPVTVDFNSDGSATATTTDPVTGDTIIGNYDPITGNLTGGTVTPVGGGSPVSFTVNPDGSATTDNSDGSTTVVDESGTSTTYYSDGVSTQVSYDSQGNQTTETTYPDGTSVSTTIDIFGNTIGGVVTGSPNNGGGGGGGSSE